MFLVDFVLWFMIITLSTVVMMLVTYKIHQAFDDVTNDKESSVAMTALIYILIVTPFLAHYCPFRNEEPPKSSSELRHVEAPIESPIPVEIQDGGVGRDGGN